MARTLQYSRRNRQSSGPISSWLGPVIAIAVVGVLAYSQSFSAQFTEWDDWDNVAKNPALLGGPKSLIVFWTQLKHPAGDMYIPVTHTAWYLLSQVARLDKPDAAGIELSPTPFHVANVFLHLLNASLVYLLLARLVKNRWAATAGAMLYLLHPLQVEPVAWVTGLKDVLSGTFSLLCLLSWIMVLETRRTVRVDHPRFWLSVWYGVTIAAFALGALSKPSAIGVPILAAVLGAAWLCRAARDKASVESDQPFHTKLVNLIFVPLIPLFLLAVPLAMEARRAQPVSDLSSVLASSVNTHAASDGPAVSLGWRYTIAGDALAFYLYKLFAPFSLGIDYGRRPDVVIARGWFLWTWLIPLAIAGAAFWRASRRPLLLAAVLIFFLAPITVLGLVAFKFQHYSTVADRYVYLGMLGPALAMAVILNRCAGRVAYAIGGVILLGLGVLTFIQTGHWRDDLSVFEHAAVVNPASITAHSHLGQLYAASGRTGDAVREYELALRIRPDDAPTHYNLGNLLLRQQRFAEAIDQYLLALPQRPDDAPLRNNMGIALARSGKLQEAAAAFREALRIDPGYRDASDNLQRAIARLGGGSSSPPR